MVERSTAQGHTVTLLMNLSPSDAACDTCSGSVAGLTLRRTATSSETGSRAESVLLALTTRRQALRPAALRPATLRLCITEWRDAAGERLTSAPWSPGRAAAQGTVTSMVHETVERS